MLKLRRYQEKSLEVFLERARDKSVKQAYDVKAR